MKKIDFHCHTTKRKLQEVIPKSADLESISQEMQRYEIETTVLLATYFPHKSSGISNYRLSDWIRNRKEFVMFGSLDFEHYFYQGYNELEELAERKAIKGIKIYTQYQNIDVRGEKLKRVLKLAGQQSLPVLFHLGHGERSAMRQGSVAPGTWVGVKEIERIAFEHDNLNIVVAHLAKPYSEQLIDTIKRSSNLYADCSGLIQSGVSSPERIRERKENLRQFVHECGTKKLLFGTDFPIQTHADSIALTEYALEGFSGEEKADVYHNNAKRLLQ